MENNTAEKMQPSYAESEHGIGFSEERLAALMKRAACATPSAFDSESTRLVLLKGQSHTQFWSLVRETVRETTPDEVFAQTEKKIDHDYANGYGTFLIFEDTEKMEQLKKNAATEKEAFSAYAGHMSVMQQLALWLMFEDEGLGVSLQHYNPMIDETVREAFALPRSWKLIAQLPVDKPRHAFGHYVAALPGDVQVLH